MLVITGSIRSGTSILCYILQSLGLKFCNSDDELYPGDVNNPLGYFERLDVQRYWTQWWQTYCPIVPGQFYELHHDLYTPNETKNIQSFLTNLNVDAVKLVMFSHTPEWFLDDILVFCFRHPNAVTHSVRRCFSNKLNNEAESAYLWYNHHVRFFQHLKDCHMPIILVDYDECMSKLDYSDPITCLKACGIQIDDKKFDSRNLNYTGPPKDTKITNVLANQLYEYLQMQAKIQSTYTVKSQFMEWYREHPCANWQLIPITLENFSPCKCNSGQLFRQCCGRSFEEKN